MELLRALGALAEPPIPELGRLAAELDLGELPSSAEHTELFSFQLVPYASVYLDPSGMLGGEARDRIAGFWRALELAPPKEPDHLCTLLTAHAAWSRASDAASSEMERRLWRHRATAFLGEHLLSWLGPYLLAVEALAAGSFYGRWARLLAHAVARERRRLAPPLEPSQHHRLSRALDDADAESPDNLAAALLAPIRSGLVLTRRDLARAARQLGLAGRIGERRYMLLALDGQDPAALRNWLIDLARERRALYRERAERSDPTLEIWAERAGATIALLGSRASSDDDS
ncbi:MAG: molecular chaperone TorD family protein [Thermoanaerobaculia bacterium]|nr:molecular chaperone TorD family protein [Thermoanaerobaculia bacterium]